MNSFEKEQMYKALPVEIKKEIIQNSLCLDSTDMGLRPPVCNLDEEFYFVSYAHGDYREVYQDIYDLQELGVKIFYDRGGLIEGTKDWREVAKNYISRENCIGVVFYISENSLLSSSIHEEIERTKELEKPFVCINLPVKRKLTYEGRDICGETLCAAKLLEILRANGSEIDNEKYNYISDFFNEHILYTQFADKSTKKKLQLEKLPKPALFHYSLLDSCAGKLHVQLSIVNVIEIGVIEEKDYLRNDIKNLRNDIDIKNWVLKSIGQCAFSNRRNLTSIYLPDTVERIEPYAFYNCHSLQSIDLTNVRYIQDSAFTRCISLEKLNIPSKVIEIGNNSFLGCTGLEEINVSAYAEELGEKSFFRCNKLINADLAQSGIKRICKSAFELCKSLTTISLPDSLEEIGSSAFRGCSFSSFKFPENVTKIGALAFNDCNMLEHITIPGSIKEISNSAFNDCKALKKVIIKFGVEKIEAGAFHNCTSLQEIYLPKSLTDIKMNAFASCLRLEKIYFDGTLAEWEKLYRNAHWADDANNFTVVCNDSKIKKNGCMVDNPKTREKIWNRKQLQSEVQTGRGEKK